MKTRHSQASAAGAVSDFVFKEPGDDAAYDAWFREQVRIGLESVARGETADHKAVRLRWQQKRAELLGHVGKV